MSETVTKRKVPITLQIAIMLIPMLQIGLGVITPVINTIAQQFPDIPLSTIMLAQTMPNLFMIPFALISGIVAGRGPFTYRRLVIFGTAIWCIGGLLPFFFHGDFWTILVSRAIYGIGSGTLYPMGQILVYNYITDKASRPRILGNNTIAMNLGGIFFQYAAGFLATIQWNFAFACYFIGIFSFISAILWLKKPENAGIQEAREDQPVKLPFGQAIKKVPAFIWIMVFCFFLSSLTSSPGTSLMSSYVASQGLGDSATTSLILICYQAGSIITGFIFSQIFRFCKRWSAAVGWAIMGLGFFMLYFGPHNIYWLMFCLFFRGLGFMIWFPTIQQEIGLFAPEGADSAVSGVQMCLMNVAMFIGGYYSTGGAALFGSNDLFFIWVISGVIQCIIAVFMILIHLKDRPEFHLMAEKQ